MVPIESWPNSTPFFGAVAFCTTKIDNFKQHTNAGVTYSACIIPPWQYFFVGPLKNGYWIKRFMSNSGPKKHLELQQIWVHKIFAPIKFEFQISHGLPRPCFEQCFLFLVWPNPWVAILIQLLFMWLKQMSTLCIS